jgi:uncharacterized protein (UPF0332 family)
MANDTEGFLQKARESLLGAESEFTNGRYNNSANRSYYACFQAALAALLSAGIRPTGPTITHTFVAGGFVGQLVNRRKLYPSALRDTLRRNLELRHDADYRVREVSQVQASRALRRARGFVEAIRPTRGGEQT